MKTLKKEISGVSSACKAGKNLRDVILKQGLRDGTLVHIKNIIKNHPDDKLQEFFIGLLGESSWK